MKTAEKRKENLVAALERYIVWPTDFIVQKKRGSYKDWRKYVTPMKGKKKEDIVNQIDKIAYGL